MSSKNPSRSMQLVCSACGVVCANMRPDKYGDDTDCIGTNGVTKSHFQELERKRLLWWLRNHSCNGGCDDCENMPKP